MKPFRQVIAEATSGPTHKFHKTLIDCGFSHDGSRETRNRFARADDPNGAMTVHSYSKGDHKVLVDQYHTKPKELVAHGRYKQSNGIIAPAMFDTAPQIKRWVERNKI